MFGFGRRRKANALPATQPLPAAGGAASTAAVRADASLRAIQRTGAVGGRLWHRRRRADSRARIHLAAPRLPRHRPAVAIAAAGRNHLHRRVDGGRIVVRRGARRAAALLRRRRCVVERRHAVVLTRADRAGIHPYGAAVQRRHPRRTAAAQHRRPGRADTRRPRQGQACFPDQPARDAGL